MTKTGNDVDRLHRVNVRDLGAPRPSTAAPSVKLPIRPDYCAFSDGRSRAASTPAASRRRGPLVILYADDRGHARRVESGAERSSMAIFPSLRAALSLRGPGRIRLRRLVQGVGRQSRPARFMGGPSPRTCPGRDAAAVTFGSSRTYDGSRCLEEASPSRWRRMLAMSGPPARSRHPCSTHDADVDRHGHSMGVQIPIERQSTTPRQGVRRRPARRSRAILEIDRKVDGDTIGLDGSL